MFVGREDELGMLERLYRNGVSRWSCFTGGGVSARRRCLASSRRESRPSTSPRKSKAPQ